MTSKMSMSRGGNDSIVGYNKSINNYTVLPIWQNNNEEYDSEYDSEDDFYDHYEEEFDDGDYQPFIPEEVVEKEPRGKTIKPVVWINSPTKSVEKSPTKNSTWWDSKPVNTNTTMINGILNYAALLPPPTPKPKVVGCHLKKKKRSDAKRSDDKRADEKRPYEKKIKKEVVSELQKPTRFCLSIIKKLKCFHGTKCRFAHDYSDLKECNFGEKCKKISVVKINPDGTLEFVNKNEVGCNFKHSKESKTSYLKRVGTTFSPNK